MVEFNNIKHDIGVKLLNYVLNENNCITDISSFDSLELTQIQIKVLKDLYEVIKSLKIRLIQCDRVYLIEDFASNLPSILIENENIFNHYRRICGGNFPTFHTDDKILDYLIKICTREYPNFLLKPHNITIYHEYHIHLSKREMEEFYSLLKNDILYELTNKEKNHIDSGFFINLENNQGYSGWAHELCSTLINRSFYNSCYKMRFNLIDVIEEIKSNLDKIRLLAQDNEIEYSTFIGIKGLELINFKQLCVKNIMIRQIEDFLTPSPHISKIILGRNPGCILEIKHKTKKTNCNSTQNNTNISNEIQDIVDKLRLSLIFSSLEDKGISTTFYEDGFPLHQVGNFYGMEDYSLKKVEITDSHIEKIIFWYNHLSEVNLSKIKVAMDRLKIAIIERGKPEDSILDAMIAWEAMFSDSFETVFKVTGSIYKFINPINKKITYERLKTLYDIRSELVHGKQGKKLQKEDLNKLREEVIKIGLECLCQLLQNKELLDLSPPERVKKIMIES